VEPARNWLCRVGAWLSGRRKVQFREIHLPEE
jgi:hypothetical protein